MKFKILSDLLDRASKAYYEGAPIMSDKTFDKLAGYISYDKVGYESLSRDKKPHLYRMYSLKKHYKEDGEPPFSITENETVRTPKLDGAAVSHLYLSGQYVMSLTRGDGISGIDITDKFIDGRLIPLTIPDALNPVQVTGELVAPKSIPNARNYAAGALNLDDIEEFKKRKLVFIAYGYECPEAINSTYSADMNYLSTIGFSVVTDSLWEDYPQDGLVFRIDSNAKFQELGYTAKHPRGAYALKDRDEGEIAQIKEVVWETGKTGKVTPVAIITPVVINGATITRVTLNNPGFIEELDIDIGDWVEVIRAGDIIPCIVGKVDVE